MKKRERYRVLLMCKTCDKVYNGSPFVPYAKAIRIYHATLVNNKDTCKNKDCEEPLTPIIEDTEKPVEKKITRKVRAKSKSKVSRSAAKKAAKKSGGKNENSNRGK